jgi:ribosomal protein S15P/S13E
MNKGFALFNQKLREKFGVVSSDEITKNNEVDELSRKTELMTQHLSKLTGEFAKSFKASQKMKEL